MPILDKVELWVHKKAGNQTRADMTKCVEEQKKHEPLEFNNRINKLESEGFAIKADNGEIYVSLEKVAQIALEADISILELNNDLTKALSAAMNLEEWVYQKECQSGEPSKYKGSPVYEVIQELVKKHMK